MKRLRVAVCSWRSSAPSLAAFYAGVVGFWTTDTRVRRLIEIVRKSASPV